MQSLKIIFSLAAFSFVALVANNRVLDSQGFSLENEAQIAATSFAQRLLEEISLKNC